MSAALANAALVGAGAALLARVLRARYDRALTAATLALLLLGTFALDLLARPLPAGAAASFALAALALFARAGAGTPRALVVGAAAGLCAAQHAPGGALVLLAWPRAGEGARGPLLALAAAAVTAAAGAATRARALAAFGPWDPLHTLFGSRQGLLHLTPALWLAVAGLLVLWRRREPDAAPVAAALAAMVAAHAACRTAEGAACPREQLAPVLALAGLPLAEALAALGRLVRRRPAVPLWAAGLALLGGNLLFMQQYAEGMIPRDFPLRFPHVAGNSATLFARAVGSPLSWPANWIFARLHRTGPDRFDAAAGKALPRDASGAAALDVGRLDHDQALLLEGWSVRHPCGLSVCRAVESRARVLLPFPSAAPASVTVRAAGGGRLSLAPVPSAAAAPLSAQPADLCFAPTPGRGLRVFTLAVTAAPRAPAPRALVDSITVSPRPCP